MGRGRLTLIFSAVTAVLAVSMLAAVGAGASTTTVTTRVKAILSGGSPPKLRLRIIRNGRTAYDQPVRLRDCGGGYCTATPVPPARSAVYVGGLQTGAEPAVVVGLFTGGAHCCFVDQVFTYDPARRTYAKAQHDFLDAGARIQRLGGRVVFKSTDARISENAFTDYADSGAPLQIWQFARGRFVDVTRSYPALLKADAALWLRAFNHHISNGVGFIAAWAADEDLLGNSALVSSTLNSLARRHKLHSALGLPHHNSETAFVSALEKFLRQLGYTG
jgi:hypothetical protein